MEEIGVKELKAHTSEILRRVREERKPIAITYRGRVVAHLLPAKDWKAMDAHNAQVMKEIEELAKEIGAEWPKGVSAVDAVREQRREL